MADKGTVLVYGAAYKEFGEALKDFNELSGIHNEGDIGGYDAAIAKKEESGYVVLTNVDSTGRFKGGVAGAAAGAVLGMIFPPSVLGMAALGVAGGAAAGNARKLLGRSDFKELADVLDAGESGVIIVTDTISERGFEKLLTRAVRRRYLEVDADKDAIMEAAKNRATGAGSAPVSD